MIEPELHVILTCDSLACDEPSREFSVAYALDLSRPDVALGVLAKRARADAARIGWTHPTIDGHEFDHCPECSR